MESVVPKPGPWRQTLEELAERASSTIRVACPFVKTAGVGVLLERKPPQVTVHLVSVVKAAHYHRGVSDTDALRAVLNSGGQVTNNQRLHAKVYLFDETAAVVTSANLTERGLSSPYEYGVLLRDHSLVAQVSADFERLCPPEVTGPVGEDALAEIDSMLAQLPPPARVAYPNIPALEAPPAQDATAP